MSSKSYKFYSKDLQKGKCKCCSEMSNEILKTTDMCIECEITNKVEDDLMNLLNL